MARAPTTPDADMSMSMSNVEQEIQTVSMTREIEIAAPIEIAFEAMLDEIGPKGEMPNGKPLPFVVEPWPGGRWYRDLGNNSGHLWGHVQVIKPPIFLELRGPMFMSFPAINHVQYRLTAHGEGTRLKFTHWAMGPIPEEVRENAGYGWDYGLKRIAEIASRLMAERER
jgi:Activator of Hsp90 ATPase homolog 1-like protein